MPETINFCEIYNKTAHCVNLFIKKVVLTLHCGTTDSDLSVTFIEIFVKMEGLYMEMKLSLETLPTLQR